MPCEMLVDKRLRIAMKPLDLEGFIDRHPTMFNWRIRVVLGAGEWKELGIEHFVSYEYFESIRDIKLYIRMLEPWRLK